MVMIITMNAPADRRLYAPYLEAGWGFKNHWYPALFSHELGAGAVKGVELLGVPILLRRAGGQVYALHDRCLHRGVKISLKPTCFTDSTVSCWYHGFTYDLASGKVVTIVAAPDDKLIGHAKLRTFPVLEQQGMIFVFVGDPEFAPPPPLADDLPIKPDGYKFRSAHFLDDNAVILGIRRTAASNWRLGVENSFDPGHQLIHQDAKFVVAVKANVTLGYKPIGPEAVQTFEGDGPKGILNRYDLGAYEKVLENEVLGLRSKFKETYQFSGRRTSAFLPGVLMVENFPDPKMTQFEWFVPIDDRRHEYWSVIAAWCADETEREEFRYRYEKYFEPLILGEFNDQDIFAREAMQHFYANGGWEKEQLCVLDTSVVQWRKVAARYNRGIQPPLAG